MISFIKPFPAGITIVFLSILFGSFSDKFLAEIQVAVIPKPAEMIFRNGNFQFNSKTAIAGDYDDPDMVKVLNYLADIIERSTNTSLKMVKYPQRNSISFVLDKDIRHPEAYKLKVTKKDIQVSYNSPKGAFYAVQTIRQLLPPAIETNGNLSVKDLKISCVNIYDEPRFPYRGMHLDVARHFFPVELVKSYLDLMAMYKMNTFHWHLTEDQGWRIEILKYPKLMEVGAWRKETMVGHYSDQPHQFDGVKYGGYYTQEEIREVVQYAADRFITVVPEIEMPGHSLAALASYPWLGCFPERNYEVATKWGVFEDVYCPKEETFEFLENVLLEVMELFPSEYIHIGGDECPKTTWKQCPHCQNLISEKGLKDENELQSYFISRIEKFLNKHGRQIIGWDEILEGGLAPNATVMSWRGEEGGIEAAEMGHNAIMTPVSHCYFDYYQSREPGEPLAIGGFLPVRKVYDYEPVPEQLESRYHHHILGAQGNVWTEYMKTPSHVEYMVLPRLPALSEVVWTPRDLKDFKDFVERMKQHRSRYDMMKLNYAKHIFQE
jgi:hexosaminidase